MTESADGKVNLETMSDAMTESNLAHESAPATPQLSYLERWILGTFGDELGSIILRGIAAILIGLIAALLLYFILTTAIDLYHRSSDEVKGLFVVWGVLTFIFFLLLADEESGYPPSRKQKDADTYDPYNPSSKPLIGERLAEILNQYDSENPKTIRASRLQDRVFRGKITVRELRPYDPEWDTYFTWSDADQKYVLRFPEILEHPEKRGIGYRDRPPCC